MHFNIWITYFSIAVFFWQFELTCTHTSTVWRLNPSNGTIVTGKEKPINSKKKCDPSKVRNNLEHNANVDNDYVFCIITTLKKDGGFSSGWIQKPQEKVKHIVTFQRQDNKTRSNTTTRKETMRDAISATLANDKLNCGKPVNYTIYDKLPGIEQRHFYHPPVPEPEAAYVFLRTQDELAYQNFNLEALERKLKQMRYAQRNSMSFELYTHIGNYFRIIGNSREAIECFRHALAKRTHSKALRNLARVLFHLNYLSDAMRITLKSISIAPNGYVPWQEYFTLGEIFKVSGRTKESSFHLRRALELNPDHEPILRVLRDVENSVLSTIHLTTLCIIIFLVIAVFVIIIASTVKSSKNSSNSSNPSSNFGSTQYDGESSRSQKQFNRSMAIRSLKKHKRF